MEQFVFAAVSLFSAVIVYGFGVYVWLLAPRRRTNLLYLLLSLSLSFRALVEFGYRISESSAQARFWWHLDVLWPFFPAFYLHMVLILTEQRRLLASKATYVVLYAPAALFAAADLIWHGVTGPPVERWWGYQYTVATGSLFVPVASTWLYTTMVVPALFLAHALWRGTDPIRRRQLALMLLASGLVVVVTLATDVSMQIIHLDFPGMLSPMLLVADVIVGVAIMRYGLFQLTPSGSADSILHTMSDGLFLLDARGEIASVNEAMLAMLGAREADVLGAEVSRFIESDDGGTFSPTDEIEGAEHITTTDIEGRCVPVKGPPIAVSISLSRIESRVYAFTGFVCLVRDISRRKEVERQLTRYRDDLEELVAERTADLTAAKRLLEEEIGSRERAEEEQLLLERELQQAQKMEAIGRLAGGVAHDFNNLLTAISGNAAFALMDLHAEDPLRDHLEQIEEASERAAKLTRQLLAFSRKQVIEPRVIDLRELLRDLEKLLHRLLGDDIEVVIRTDSEPCTLLCDAGQMEQVLVNLAVNARDAMPDGGVLTIGCAKSPPPDPSRRAGANDASELWQQEQLLRLSVNDTGIGMDAETRSKIFEPFFTTKAEGVGTGLGLATSFGIVKQHGGAILVESEPGWGSTFEIYLPSVPQPTTPAEATVKRGIPRGDETILLVEDDDAVRHTAKRILERAGYTVYDADSGPAALALLKGEELTPELLLTDVVMPEMNGRELQRRAAAARPSMGTLFMSGYQEDVIARHGLLDEGIEFIAKPFTPTSLTRRVREVLDGAGRADRPRSS